jgi:hypothetical protein
MKRILPIILLVCLFSKAFSQFDERVFFQLGGTVGFDYTQMKGKIGEGLSFYDITNNQINYATVIFTTRLNFLEFSNNSSMSLDVQPALSLGRAYNSVGGNGNASFRLPAFLELNFGAASTVSTRKDYGFGIGIGAQYMKYPLMGNVPVYNGTHAGEIYSINSSWICPTLQMGLKFFGKSYYCREINLRATYGASNKLDNNSETSSNQVIKDFQTMGVMISFLQYLNY